MDYLDTKIDCTDPTLQTHIVTVTCPQDILATGKIGENRGDDAAMQYEDLQMKVCDLWIFITVAKGLV